MTDVQKSKEKEELEQATQIKEIEKEILKEEIAIVKNKKVVSKAKNLIKQNKDKIKEVATKRLTALSDNRWHSSIMVGLFSQ